MNNWRQNIILHNLFNGRVVIYVTFQLCDHVTVFCDVIGSDIPYKLCPIDTYYSLVTIYLYRTSLQVASYLFVVRMWHVFRFRRKSAPNRTSRLWRSRIYGRMKEFGNGWNHSPQIITWDIDEQSRLESFCWHCRVYKHVWDIWLPSQTHK